MRASAPPARSRLAGQARSRLVAAAAVVAIVVVGGFSYLALRGDDSTTPSVKLGAHHVALHTADGSAKASPQPQSEASGSTADGAGNAAQCHRAAAPRDLGDLGDLQIGANLDRLRATANSSALNSTTSEDRLD